MIRAIFYSKFDTQEGPKVVHQVPDGAIVASPTTVPQQVPFFTFSDISFFVIPRQELCGNLLQVCTGGYRILGYPICMKSPRYDRNEFIFNFCLVLAEDEDFSMYKSVVQKLADLMHGLEEQSGFLTRDHSKSGEGKVYSLCETLMEDLNNYSECMIPIDELNTLNIKLFPIYPAPPHVKAWEVPLFTVRYETFMDENWDLTMQRIVPYINGVNSVRIISILADVEISLTNKAIRHLLYYGCIFLLDIFSFSAIYAPTANFSSMIACDEGMQQECARYCNTQFAPVPIGKTPSGVGGPPGTSASHSDTAAVYGSHRFEIDEIWPLMGTADGAEGGGHKDSEAAKRQIVDGVGIVELYANLRQGQSVKQWYAQHSQQLANIDVRRFITFGIIKGFLYRVHKYAYGPKPENFTMLGAASKAAATSMSSIKGGIAPPTAPSAAADASATTSRENSVYMDGGEEHLVGDHHHAMMIPSHNGSAATRSIPTTAATSFEEIDVENDDDDDEDDDDQRQQRTFLLTRSLEKYLDGQHCFDEICTELQISERELATRLKKMPWEIHIIHR